MDSPLSDTHPEITALQQKLLREATPARKLEIVGQMYLTLKQLALAGLRSQYPEDSPILLNRRLADRILGPELALKVYGPLKKEG
jgi:hypothetical protein